LIWRRRNPQTTDVEKKKAGELKGDSVAIN
jgi:hypothetical protein